jgi:hypothetical protein
MTGLGLGRVKTPTQSAIRSLSRLLQPEALLVPEWAHRRGRLEVAGKEAALMPASMAAGPVSLVVQPGQFEILL